MGNCFSSPEAKEKIASVEAQAKAKGTETLEGLKGKLQGTGTTGQATAAQPTAGTGTAAAPAGQAPAGGAATGAAPATGAMGGGMAGIEGEAAKLAKAEEPKLAQEAKAEFTGAGGAGTTAAAPGTTPAAT